AAGRGAARLHPPSAPRHPPPPRSAPGRTPAHDPMGGARRLRPPRGPSSAASALLAALVLAPCAATAPAHAGAPMWSLPTLMSRIDGARVLIGGWSRRLPVASTLCRGEGRGRGCAGAGPWRRFRRTGYPSEAGAR